MIEGAAVGGEPERLTEHVILIQGSSSKQASLPIVTVLRIFIYFENSWYNYFKLAIYVILWAYVDNL